MRAFFSGSSSASNQSPAYRQSYFEGSNTEGFYDDYDDLKDDSDISYEDSDPGSDSTFPSRGFPGHEPPRQPGPAATNTSRQQMPGQFPTETDYGSTGGQSSSQSTTGPPAHALQQSFPEWAMREPAQRYQTSAGSSSGFNISQSTTSRPPSFARQPVQTDSISSQQSVPASRASIPRKPVNTAPAGDRSHHARANTAPKMPARTPIDGSSKKILIAVFGMTGTGKTSFIKTLAGEAANHFRIGHELESCTQEIETVDFKLDGRDVTTVDTPGFDDSKRSDTEILQLIADWLERSYKEKTLLSGIIYLHRISDVRMTNSSIKNLTMVRKLCGTEHMSKVCLMTTMWDKVTEQEGSAREAELIRHNDFWSATLAIGASARRHDDGINSAQAAIRSLMDNEPTAIKLQNEIVSEGKTLIQTDAGGAINEDIVMTQKKHKEELKALTEEMGSKMAQENERLRASLQAHYERTFSQLEQQYEDQAKLAESRDKSRERQWQEATQECERYEREVRASAARDREILMDTQRELEQTKLFVAERDREREHSFRMAAARQREELEQQARERKRFARATSARELYEPPRERGGYGHGGYDEHPRRREAGGGRDGPNTVKSRSDNPPLNRQQALMTAQLKQRREKYNGQQYYTLHCYMPGVFSNSGCGEGFDIVNPRPGKIQCCYCRKTWKLEGGRLL